MIHPSCDVLIVEDSADLREGVTAILEDAGLSAMEAGSGLTALRMLRDGLIPRAILLDVTMPGMGGVETIAAIRSDPGLAASAIVVMTGFSDDDLSLPVATMLRKPFRAQELLNVLWPLVRGTPYVMGPA